MVWPIVYALVGIYCIFSGVKTLLTGKLTANIEKKLETYSQKGARRYRQISAICNIIGGVIVICFAVVSFLVTQKILPDSIYIKIGFLAVVLVMAVVMVVAQSKCKNITDDE